jgi:hypothetical protein
METRTCDQIKIEPNGRVYLHLPPTKDYKAVRQIGRIIFESKTFLTFRKSNHYYRKFKGLGINHKLLSEFGSYIDVVKIEYEGKILVTSRLFFLEFGKLDHHEANQLDAQIFLDLSLFGWENVDLWKRGKLRKKEGTKPTKKLAIQFSIF